MLASARFPFTTRLSPTHFAIAGRFKNIFHADNSRRYEKLIPHRRRARPAACGISARDFHGVTERWRFYVRFGRR